MNQSTIFGPFFAMMLLTLVVWVYLYMRRIPFIHRNNLRPEQLAAVEFVRLSPPAVVNPSDNFRNLFELPTIFYAIALYLYVQREVDGVDVIAAWIFVGFRILHSAVHCGSSYSGFVAAQNDPRSPATLLLGPKPTCARAGDQ